MDQKYIYCMHAFLKIFMIIWMDGWMDGWDRFLYFKEYHTIFVHACF